MDKVVETYNNIANDFSLTRRKTWNSVAKFIDTFEEDSLNGDIGCGNGKNMLYNNKLNFKGMDICDEFIKICLDRKLDVIKGCITDIPFNSNSFDNIICIAVIHHLSRKEDRIKAIQELYRICKHNGRIMIYVWAFEQPNESKRKFTSQDELVEFKKRDNTSFYRYYHLYKKNELETEITESKININIIESNYEYGNWYVIIEKK